MKRILQYCVAIGIFAWFSGSAHCQEIQEGPATTSIERALYGAHGQYVDVTRIVQGFAYQGAPMKVSNETFGIDPLKGEEKKLRIIFVGPEGRYEKRYDEDDTVHFER